MKPRTSPLGKLSKKIFCLSAIPLKAPFLLLSLSHSTAAAFLRGGTSLSSLGCLAPSKHGSTTSCRTWLPVQGFGGWDIYHRGTVDASGQNQHTNLTMSTTNRVDEPPRMLWLRRPPHKPHALSSVIRVARLAVSVVLVGTLVLTSVVSPSTAAPPIAIIAEELGYYPIQNRNGDVMYVPQRVQRESTEQSVLLAQQLRDRGVVLVGTYWCPHTSRQKELLGRQAAALIRYVECAPRGYQANPALCLAQKVDGYPTWLFPGGKQLAGERPLSELAKEVGFVDFKPELEKDVAPLSGGSCGGNLKGI